MISDDAIAAEMDRALEQVPDAWRNEVVVKQDVAMRLGISLTKAAGQLAYLRLHGLIERRAQSGSMLGTEVRRVGR